MLYWKHADWIIELTYGHIQTKSSKNAGDNMYLLLVYPEKYIFTRNKSL